MAKKSNAWNEDIFPLTMVFVRHGEADAHNVDQNLGAPLTRLGRRQAARVGKRLADEKFDHIYTSNLSRAYDTAAAILDRLQAPVALRPDGLDSAAPLDARLSNPLQPRNALEQGTRHAGESTQQIGPQRWRRKGGAGIEQ